VKFDFSSFVELSDLKGDSYAESLVQTINTALQNKGGKVEAIQDLLTELYNKLVSDQQAANKAWNTRETSLNKTISDTQATITKLTTEIATAQKHLANVIKKIKQAKVNLKQYNSQLTNDNAMVATLGIKRKTDHATYKENVKNHQDLILALESVIKELAKLKGSISGVGRPANVQEIAAEKRDAAWAKAHPSLLEIFTHADLQSFAQVATEADQDALTKLIGLLKNLKLSAEKSLQDDDQNEKDSIKFYKKSLTRLKSDISLLNTTIKRQNDNLTKYRRRRISLKTEITDKTNLLVKNQAFLATTIETRRTEKLKYEEDKRGRNREKSIIRKLQTIVDEKLARMKDYLKKRVNS